MGIFRVGQTKYAVTDTGRHRTTAIFSWGTTNVEAYFETDSRVPFLRSNAGDLWLAPALMMAMRHNLTLELHDPISDSRLENLDVAQDIISTWYPDRMSKVVIKAPPSARRKRFRRRDTRAIGACFTGGVDSFHTLVKNRGRIGALIYGYGLDIPLGHPEFEAEVTSLLEQVAAAENVQLLAAETNIRRVLGRGGVSWGYEGHGVALVSLAALFTPLIRTVLIPSSHSYSAATPWGSHPMLDHRWSSPRLQVVYDGGESSRVRKTQLIAHDPLAQKFLRVCYKQFEEFNCGRCGKCMRTMTTLQVLNQLKNFNTFPPQVDLDFVRNFQLAGKNDAARIRDVYELALDYPEHAELASVLSDMLERFDAGLANPEPVG